MKKIFALAIAIVMALALAVPAFAEYGEMEPSDAKVYFPKIEGTITIDGVKDAAYDICPVIIAEEQNVDSWSDSPLTTSGKVWAVWNGAYVYVYAELFGDDDIWTSHEGDSSIGGTIWNGDHLGIIIDWDHDKVPTDEQYSYDNNGDNVSYINIAADGDKDFFQAYHLQQDGMPYYKLTSTKAIIDSDNSMIIYEAQIPCAVTEVTVADGMQVGFEVGFTNASSEKEGRVGNVSISYHGADMWKWTHACSTATLLGLGEAVPGSAVQPVASTPADPEPAPAPVEPAPAPVEPAPAPVAPSNPTTADVSVLFYALASVSAVAGLAISKRK